MVLFALRLPCLLFFVWLNWVWWPCALGSWFLCLLLSSASVAGGSSGGVVAQILFVDKICLFVDFICIYADYLLILQYRNEDVSPFNIYVLW